MNPLLEIRNLSKDFHSGFWRSRRITALQAIDLLVYPGETLGLVGESGSGKTTLAKCAVGLLKPTSGSVYFNGVNLDDLSFAQLRKQRRNFQIIFQDAPGSLNPHKRLEDLLLEPFDAQGLGTKNEKKRWVRELLHTVALDESLLPCYPTALSGGQLQRIAIARALALKPKLIIADEPVSSLDVTVQSQILKMLSDLQRSFGLTLVLISHSLPVIRHLCSRIAVMYRGKIVEEAPSDIFFQSPRHPYSEHLLQCTPIFNPEGKQIRTNRNATNYAEEDIRETTHNGCSFNIRCPKAQTRCRMETPELRADGNGIKTACFL